MITYRSYHGTDKVKGIKFYYPDVSDADAKSAASEMDAIDWSKFGDDMGYQRAKWLVERLGKPA